MVDLCKIDDVVGPLAQLVEQLTLNQLVVGSIPTRPTNSITYERFLRTMIALLSGR